MDIKQGGDGTNAEDVEGEGELLLVLRALLLKQNEQMDEMQQEMKSMRQLIVRERGQSFVAADEEPVAAVGVATIEEPSLTDKTPLGVWQHRGAALAHEAPQQKGPGLSAGQPPRQAQAEGRCSLLCSSTVACLRRSLACAA